MRPSPPLFQVFQDGLCCLHGDESHARAGRSQCVLACPSILSATFVDGARTTHKLRYPHATSTPYTTISILPKSHILVAANMSDAPKLDSAAEQHAAPGATLVKDETDLAVSGVTEADKAPETSKTTEEKTTEEKPAATSMAGSAVETVTSTASSAAAAVKDNVFSMFGGGPKKEKKEEVDDVDEPSGATKKAADKDVSRSGEMLCF